jgi:hypothetical protein
LSRKQRIEPQIKAFQFNNPVCPNKLHSHPPGILHFPAKGNNKIVVQGTIHISLPQTPQSGGQYVAKKTRIFQTDKPNKLCGTNRIRWR